MISLKHSRTQYDVMQHQG